MTNWIENAVEQHSSHSPILPFPT